MNKVSSWARIKCAIVFIVLMIFSIGPVPITSMIGLFVVIFRPNWFKKLVDNIYADKNDWFFYIYRKIIEIRCCPNQSKVAATARSAWYVLVAASRLRIIRDYAEWPSCKAWSRSGLCNPDQNVCRPQQFIKREKWEKPCLENSYQVLSLCPRFTAEC